MRCTMISAAMSQNSSAKQDAWLHIIDQLLARFEMSIIGHDGAYGNPYVV